MAKVSVIIPTFGLPKYLNKSINSVKKQSFKNWELIIVDDNNPNTKERKTTEKIMNQYLSDDRIQYIQHEHNQNGAVARNTGLRIAKGEYIAFLDSDDEYKPERLKKCVEVMDKASADVAGVYTGCEFRKSGKVYHVEQNVKPGNFFVQTLACTFMFCTGSNIFIRKSVIDELEGFDGSFLRHQDYEFLVRVFKKYSLEAIQEVLVIKNNENVNLPDANKMIEIKRQYLAKYKDYIANLPKADQKCIYHCQWLAIAEAAQRSKEYEIARKYYKKAAKYGGLSVKEQLRRIAFRIKSI